MHLHQLAIRLSGTHGAVCGRQVTPSGLHGVFYDVIKRVDPDAATRLHEHWAPKPYTIAPAHYDKRQRQLAGLLISTLNEETALVVLEAFKAAYEQQTELHIGRQLCFVSDLSFLDSSSFELLSHSDPCERFDLQFLTPTAWKAGHGAVIVPSPHRIFARPYEVWQTFSAEKYRLPNDWLDWCERNVFITEHETRSVKHNINYKKKFKGFVGYVQLTAKIRRDADEQQTRLYLSVLHGLARFLTYSGVGQKTTMGMGCVELLQ